MARDGGPSAAATSRSQRKRHDITPVGVVKVRDMIEGLRRSEAQQQLKAARPRPRVDERERPAREIGASKRTCSMPPETRVRARRRTSRRRSSAVLFIGLAASSLPDSAIINSSQLDIKTSSKLCFDENHPHSTGRTAVAQRAQGEPEDGCERSATAGFSDGVTRTGAPRAAYARGVTRAVSCEQYRQCLRGTRHS